MENNILKETEGMTYDDKMLYAFIGTPEKFYWYKRAFSKYNLNGVVNFEWNWSWYAFFFSFWYLLYRKVYLASGILILLYIVFGSLSGFLGFAINIILGGTLPYFVYQKYITKKKEVEENVSDDKLRIEIMSKVGGTNTTIIYLTLIFVIFFFFMLSLYFTSATSIIMMRNSF